MNKRRFRSDRHGEGNRELMFSIINTGRAVEQNLEDALTRIGLSVAKFGALTHLVEAGEALNLSECAERMTCVRSNITQLMDRLEKDGLVRRVADRQDRRVVKAEVTRLGIKRQAAGAKEVAKVQAELFRRLGDVDQDALGHVLSTIK
jgi:DNA-binding MarR family transcriptional regulator